MNPLSKDQIKDRLLKRAAKQWGYSDVELENVFDPIVNLLFDVCAKELEKISHEVFSSRRRININADSFGKSNTGASNYACVSRGK